MPALVLQTTDPDVRVLEKPGCVWSASGLSPAALRRLEEHGGREGLEAELLQAESDASLLKVELDGERPVRVILLRGLWSDHHLFYAWRESGDLIVTDHFRNAVAFLPVAERGISEAAVAEHFLYRQVLGGLCYCRAIRRPGHGERIEIDPATRSVKSHLFDRAVDRAESAGLPEVLGRIDAALTSVLEPLRREDGVVNQFSGGVDSTLLQSYLGDDVVALNLVPDTPEFERETRYATRAADLLGISLERHAVAEAAYLQQLEGSIDDMGLPPIHEGTVLDRECVRTDYRKFIVGEHGDTVFGMGGRKARIAHWLSPAPARWLLSRALPLLPGGLRSRVAGVVHAAAELAHPSEDPLGHPAQRNLYTDLALADEILGVELVRERLRANLDYALARIERAAPPDDALLRNLELARWVGTFDDVILPQRHLAQARGKAVASPFAAPAVVASSLAVPVERRYLRGLRDKYLLKELLGSRLPGYPVHQRKRSTELPWARYYRSGPLSDIWERYPLPDFIEGEAGQRVVAEASDLTWNAVTWAIWQERVLKSASLEPVPGTFSRRLPA